MARYIDEKDVYKLVEPSGTAKVHCSQIDELPRADVVPKSEVEMLQGALKAEERHNELTMEMAQKALKNAKAEVAREIFAEIEKKAYLQQGDWHIHFKKYDELKKEYTGE